jgi:GH25 family lysozyme M1 (1,4-beta-N-acetylmuramidase)
MLPDGYRFPDVSRYRRVENWSAYAKAYPVSACKKSEGLTHQDPYFDEWSKAMLHHGCFRIAYHFLRKEFSVQSQVENYLEGLKGDFGVCLDVEEAGNGSNPSMAQANEWLLQVAAAVNKPLSSMLVYMPRWWWKEHGGQLILGPMLWGSHYRTTPDITPYANHTVKVIQYSSSAPIVGLAQPHTGDMNVAINMTAQDLMSRIRRQPAQLPPPEEEEVPNILVVTCPGKPLRVVVEGSVTGFPAGSEEPIEYITPFTRAGYKRVDIKFREQDDWGRFMSAMSVAPEFAALSRQVAVMADDISDLKAHLLPPPVPTE